MEKGGDVMFCIGNEEYRDIAECVDNIMTQIKNVTSHFENYTIEMRLFSDGNDGKFISITLNDYDRKLIQTIIESYNCISFKIISSDGGYHPIYCYRI